MSHNKVNNKLDFRNVKQTQFDPGQVMKGSFSELKSSLRTIGTNAVLCDAYTHFVQQTNVDGYPTLVEYYQATDPAQDRLQFRADVSQDLAGTYFTLQEFLTKKTHVFYYVVGGNGSAPGIGDIETPINISENDPASVVCFATKSVLDTVEEYVVIQKSLLSSYLTLEYLQFGETEAVNVGTTGFMVTRIKEGESFEVGRIELDYDVDGNPIYNGNTLKGLLYNPYTASFDPERSTVTAEVDLDPIVSKTPQVFNVAMPVSGTEYSLTLPLGTKRFAMKIKDNKSRYTISWTSGGPSYSVSRGTEYAEDNLEIISTSDTIYFTGSKNNLTMEIITWS